MTLITEATEIFTLPRDDGGVFVIVRYLGDGVTFVRYVRELEAGAGQAGAGS